MSISSQDSSDHLVVSSIDADDAERWAVQVESLSRSFRGQPALSDVTLQVPRGAVFGLVGLNGAGKTTLIRHLVGALRALQGRVRVLGQDPTLSPERLLRRVGYMAEDEALPTWMLIEDLLCWCRSVYPDWSDDYAAELCDLFELSPRSRLRSLSRGGRARASLLAAIGHRPALLILDEPSSGLDPLARADILEAIIRTTADEGRTVIFSSHLLDEIDRVCDQIALIHQGRVLETIDADSLPQRYEERCYRANLPTPEVPPIEHAFGARRNGAEWSVVVDRQRGAGAEPDSERWTMMSRQPVTLQRWFAGRVQTPRADSLLASTPSPVGASSDAFSGGQGGIDE
ncbi:ABC transporter ATP-binding protein [Roseiconus nitratireducens]|uniref:ABC transporter ATP-binding protein n=1 Tax=Roseiconus nitratireducens TaxID=2605748 RepID=A0A5M6DCA9_9BACT|nr:ABC transporter ATP-binding protein [Roseiconus nitratireducens]KAA5545187.1 ABC transporter ATP-binding protein [Roseiconus nitratireducens]